MANLVLAISSVQILIVNTTLLPKELQPSYFRRALLVICSLFYCIFFYLMASNEVRKFFTSPPAKQAAVVLATGRHVG